MANKLWGGRFSKKTDPLVEEFTRSIQYDYKLARYDVFGSIAHVQVLRKACILTPEEAKKLTEALEDIAQSIKDKTFKADPSCEDIHTNIQNLLHEKTGDLALKLHTARSRNEQVVVSTKMYCKKELLKLQVYIAELRVVLCRLAEKNRHLVMPGFTHMQHAQPIYVTDYLMAYDKMLARDDKRLEFIADNIIITMGAGALAGTPINSKAYSVKLSDTVKGGDLPQAFSIHVTENSVDAISDRDFVMEILSSLSIIGMHISRLSEDLIIWSTKEFDFIEIDESFCTGSSLMPQKKNPDALELMRGYAGRLYGNLLSVLTMMKGLPLAYNRDMQLDKEPLFNSLEIVSYELKILAGLLKTLKFNKAKIEEYLEDESLYATDLVYYLVDKGVPFKTAHTIVGALIKHSIDSSIDIKSMSDVELKKFSDKFSREDVLKLFDPEVSVKSKRSVTRNCKRR